METIKEIKLDENKFTVLFDNSSIKLDYTAETERYIIDISDMNLINAVKTAILASTYCFINNFGKKLCWLVADEEIMRAISILRLRNIEQRVKMPEMQLELAS